ncbi:MAG: 16S rRNA (guanine(527)-N(7))-methyltransferase RsmG, partial [Sphingomicrobium sp.]
MKNRLAAVSGIDVSRETYATLEHFVDLLLQENQSHNLISADSVDNVWERHIVDGAQLVSLGHGSGRWCDIGSGAGLPGMVIAILSNQPMTLVEPRRLRCQFLLRSAEILGLEQVTIVAAKAERVAGKYDFITARAVAGLDSLLAMTLHLAHAGTRFILPKGQTAKSELDEARRNWQGSFRLVPSQTHPDAAIVVAEGVR